MTLHGPVLTSKGKDSAATVQIFTRSLCSVSNMTRNILHQIQTSPAPAAHQSLLSVHVSAVGPKNSVDTAVCAIHFSKPRQQQPRMDQACNVVPIGIFRFHFDKLSGKNSALQVRGACPKSRSSNGGIGPLFAIKYHCLKPSKETKGQLRLLNLCFRCFACRLRQCSLIGFVFLAA